MAIKRPSRGKPGGKAKPASTLQNLAARPPSFDEDIGDDQLADNSGVFRVTTNIARAQIGHDDDADPPRFASDSLVMAAQRDGFPPAAPTLDDAVEEIAVEDEAAALLKRQRLQVLAQRARSRRRP